MARATTRAYREGVLVAEGFPVSEVSEHLDDPGTVVWVDFASPSRDQLVELADELGLRDRSRTAKRPRDRRGAVPSP